MKTKRIAIVGPECSGKTTLAQALAASLDASLVPEFSRMYFKNRQYIYNATDIIEIAKGQAKLENHYENHTGNFLVCDTNNLVNLVWSLYSCKEAEHEVRGLYHPEDYRLHLLCKPDVDWEEDVLRENKENLEEIYHLYLQVLQENNIPYEVIEGSFEQRFTTALSFIERGKFQ